MPLFSVTSRLQTFSKFLTATVTCVQPLLASDPYWNWHVAQCGWLPPRLSMATRHVEAVGLNSPILRK
jgi:hypothetical protein